MANEVRKIADINFQTNSATTLSFDALHSWTIWQYPEPIHTGQCGAVKPPIPKLPWLAAIINQSKKEIQVLGHLSRTFTSPEMVFEFLQTLPGK